MKSLRLLFLGLLLPFAVNTAQAKVCLLPIAALCDTGVNTKHEGADPQPGDQKPVETCTATGEYKTLELCKVNLDADHQCIKKGDCFVRQTICPKNTYSSLDGCEKAANSLNIPTYSEWICEAVEGKNCWKPVELCTKENKALAKKQGYNVTEKDAEAKIANGSYCVKFINESCHLFKCTKAEIGFHWVREEAKKRDMYLDCTKPVNEQFCDNNYVHLSCQAGAEKHCKSIGSKMASRQDIYNYMDYINAKWKKWFPQHRDPSYGGWAMIFSQAYGQNLVPIFQVNPNRDNGDFFDTSGSNSTGCAYEGDDALNEDVGYYICIKEVEDK